MSDRLDKFLGQPSVKELGHSKDCPEYLQYRPQEHSQAPHEAFPGRSTLVEFAGERITVEFVGFVDLHEVVYEGGIHHDGILLVVVEEAAALEVGRTYHAAVSIDGHHLGVVEATVEEEHVDTPLGELVTHTLGTFGSERNIALGRDEYLHVDPTLHGMSQGAAYAGWRQEVGSDNLDLPLGLTDKPEIGIENIAIAMARMVVDNGYRHSIGIGRMGKAVVGSIDALLSLGIPHGDEVALNDIGGRALDAQVHIAPVAYTGQACDVVVGHVDTTDKCRLPIHDSHLAVVAVESVVNPRELHGVVGLDLESQLAHLTQVFAADGAVIGDVAEVVEEDAHLDTFFQLTRQERHHNLVDGVVAEVEVFEVHRVACRVDAREQVDELGIGIVEQLHAVALGEGPHHVGRVERKRLVLTLHRSKRQGEAEAYNIE